MTLKEVTKTLEGASAAMSEGAFQEAAMALTESKKDIRERLQSETAGEIETIIAKLRKREPVPTEDLALIKRWIVGDAQSYTKAENNFNDWVEEFSRLGKVLKKYEGRDCDAEELFELHGVLEDAARVAYDIAHFLEKKERIKKFESAVGDGLDDEERDTLARVLEGKLHSENY